MNAELDRNDIKFECSVDRFKEILDFVGGPEGSYPGYVDFNTIIPMPEELNIECSSRGTHGLEAYETFLKGTEMCKTQADVDELEAAIKKNLSDPGEWDLGKKYYGNKQKYGVTTWYDWGWSHWGTKWNACECQAVQPEDRELFFTTAWNGVPDLICKLSEKFPDVRITYGWADIDDIGGQAGRAVFKGGRTEDFHYPESGSKEAYELYAEVTGDDLKEMGLHLSKDGSTYEWEEPASSHNSGMER